MKTRRTLVLYLTSHTMSLFGNSAIMIVLPWLVLTRTGNPAITGLVATCSALPAALSSLVGGYLIDKIGHRRISVISDLGSALSVAALAIVDTTLGLNIAWFIALGIAGALFDAPGMAARETLAAPVAHTSTTSLDTVAALKSSLFGVSFLLGPAVGGLLLATLPAIQVVWLTSACSLIAAACMAIMPLATEGKLTSESSPFAAWHTIRNSRPLRAIMVISVGSAVMSTPFLSVILPAHFQALNAPRQLGFTLSSYAVGSILGALVYGWLFARHRWAAWASANLLFACCMIAIGSLHGVWIIASGMTLAGVASGLLQPIVTVTLTEQVAPDMRGRVFGMLTALNLVVSPVGLGLISALLVGADLRMGALVLAIGWLPFTVYSLLAPGLHRYIQGADNVYDKVKHADN